MRKEAPEIGWGQFDIVQTHTPEVLAIRYDWRRNSVLVVHNLSAIPREVSLQVDVADSRTLVNLGSGEHVNAGETGKHQLILEPYAYRWFRVGGLDYILKRSRI
jgi:maltose alpha-D-glucosyltransferase/alpha-amylase